MTAIVVMHSLSGCSHVDSTDGGSAVGARSDGGGSAGDAGFTDDRWVWFETQGAESLVRQTSQQHAAVDADGNAYVTLEHQGPLEAFGTTYANLGSTNTNPWGALLLKLSPSGTLLWAHNLEGNTLSDAIPSVPSGGGVTVVLSMRSGQANFGNGLVGVGSWAQGELLCVARFAADGTPGKSQCYSGEVGSAAHAKAVIGGPFGSILVAGWYQGSFNFGLQSLHCGSFTTQLDCNEAPFIAEYLDADYPGPAFDLGHAQGSATATGLVLDPDGSMYVAGSFTEHLDLGLGLLVSTNWALTTRSPYSDAFLAKLDGLGQAQWVKQLGRPGFTTSAASVVRVDGGVALLTDADDRTAVASNAIHSEIAFFASSGASSRPTVGIPLAFSSAMVGDSAGTLFIGGSAMAADFGNGAIQRINFAPFVAGLGPTGFLWADVGQRSVPAAFERDTSGISHLALAPSGDLVAVGSTGEGLTVHGVSVPAPSTFIGLVRGEGVLQCVTLCPQDSHCDGDRCVCNTGLTDCSGTCRDLRSDAAHCGSCATRCAGLGEQCLGGSCQCARGRSLCSGVCTPTSWNEVACGGCTTTCSASAPQTVPQCIGDSCRVVCSDGYGDCNQVAADGCEQSLHTANDCGGCGHRCGDAGCNTWGYGCNARRWYTSNSGVGIDFDVSDGTLWVGDWNDVTAVPLDGGNAWGAFTSDAGSIMALAASHAAVCVRTQSAVVCAPRPSLQPVTIAPVLPWGRMAVGGSYVFWTSSNSAGGSDVLRAPVQGGAAAVFGHVSQEREDHVALAANSSLVAWGSPSGLWLRPVDASRPAQLIDDVNVDAIALAANEVYWRGPWSASGAVLARIDLDGGASLPLGQLGNAARPTLAADALGVYLPAAQITSSLTASPVLVTYPLSGIREVRGSVFDPSRVRLDEERVWVGNGTGIDSFTR